MQLRTRDGASLTTVQTFDSQIKPGYFSQWRELFHYRYLLRNLVMRDLKARYKNSILGVFWNLLHPLLMMMVYTVLFTLLLRGETARDYPIFILVALVPWQFLNGALTTGADTIVSNANLVKKVYFPRLLLPVSALLSNFVNYLFAMLLLVVMLYAFGIGLTIHALWVPAILLTQMIFTLGLIFILSALNTFYRDIAMLLQVGLLAWFFLTPIFYPFEQITREATVMGLTFDAARLMRWINPMATMVDGYRTVLWGSLSSSSPGPMEPLSLLRTFITSVFVFVIGYYVFYRSEHLFGERL